MKKWFIAAAVILSASAAGAASLPPDVADYESFDLYTADEGEVKLPPGSWCLIFSVHNDPGEPHTLVYRRGTFDWCDPSDRVVVENP